MENDFMIKYVVPFINAAFNINDSLNVYWDTPLLYFENSNMSFLKEQTTDATFKTYQEKEVSILEVKPFNTSTEKVEENRIRLGEISKRLLHKRVLTAKSNQELVAFAIMVTGKDIEYYVHEYKPRSTSLNQYSFGYIKKSILPTFPDTYTHMMTSLEHL